MKPAFAILALSGTLIAPVHALNAPPAQENDAAAMLQEPVLPVRRCEQLIGLAVRDQQGERCGRLQDVVLAPDGRAAYAVLSLGIKPGRGGKLFALRFACLSTGGTEPAEQAFVLLPPKGRLDGAPSFNVDEWPALDDLAWCEEVDRHYSGDARAGHRPVAAAAGGREDRLALSSVGLPGTVVADASGAELGTLREVVLDPRGGRVTYVVADVGERRIAVPWGALRVKRPEDQVEMRLEVDTDRLASAPAYEDGVEGLARMSDPAWIGALYAHYGVRPYWHEEPTGGTR